MTAAAIPAELSAHLQGLPAVRDVRFASLQDWLTTRILDGLVDRIGVETFIAIAFAAYDKFIVPFDIPLIPDAVEAEFDKHARMILEWTIRGFHALIHEDKPGPMKAAMAPRIWVGELA